MQSQLPLAIVRELKVVETAKKEKEESLAKMEKEKQEKVVRETRRREERAALVLAFNKALKVTKPGDKVLWKVGASNLTENKAAFIVKGVTSWTWPLTWPLKSKDEEKKLDYDTLISESLLEPESYVLVQLEGQTEISAFWTYTSQYKFLENLYFLPIINFDEKSMTQDMPPRNWEADAQETIKMLNFLYPDFTIVLLDSEAASHVETRKRKTLE